MAGYEPNTSRRRSPARTRTRSPVRGSSAALPESSSEERHSTLSRRGSLTDVYLRWISDGPAPGLTSSPWPYEAGDISSYIPPAREAPSSYSSQYNSTSSTSPYASLYTDTPSSSTPPYTTTTTSPYTSTNRPPSPSPYASLYTTPISHHASPSFSTSPSPYSHLATDIPTDGATTSSADPGPTWSEYYASRASGSSTGSGSRREKGKGVDYGGRSGRY